MKRSMLFTLAFIAAFSLGCRQNRAENSVERESDSKKALLRLDRIAAPEGKDVTFTTSDQVVITGTLFDAGKSGAPAVLCLHQWKSDRSTYNDLAVLLQKAGITVLTIDMRGYGGSVKKTDGSVVKPDRNAKNDVSAAVGYLKALPSVDKSRIGLLGASYGSSNAILYAANDPAIKAAVLLSPGLNYFNILPTLDAMKKYAGRPVLCIAGSEDMRSVEALDAYANVNPRAVVKKFDNAGHGTDMFGTVPGLGGTIKEYFLANL